MIKISNGGVLLSDSNLLRFVRTDNYSSTKPTIFNRLTADYDYKNVSDDWNFFQKIDIGADVYIYYQFRTIYTVNSIKLYDFDDDSLVESIIPLEITAAEFTDVNYGEIKTYYFNKKTELLGGRYYIIITINTSQTYECEPFIVETIDEAECVEIKYYNDVDSNWDDAIYYDGTQEFAFYLPARFFEIIPGSEKSVFENWNNNDQTLTGSPLLSVTLGLGGIPLWLMEKINIILQHDNVFINDLEVTNKDGVKSEWVKQGEVGTFIYTGTIMFSVNDYGLNDTFEAVEAVDTNYILKKGGQRIKKKGGQYIKYKT